MNTGSIKIDGMHCDGCAALGPVEVRSLKRQLPMLRSWPSGRALSLRPAASCSSTLVWDVPLFLRPGAAIDLG